VVSNISNKLSVYVFSMRRVLTLLVHKRIIRIMSGVGAKSSRRNLLKKLYLFPITCQYILCLMVSVVDNRTNLSAHELDTGNKDQLY
jgi:hypothetical protein